MLVYWKDDKKWYGGKCLAEVKGRIRVLYEDGDIEDLDFSKETWKVKPEEKKVEIKMVADKTTVKPEGLTGRSLVGVATLVIPSLLPAVIAHYRHLPLLCLVQVILTLWLAKITINPKSPGKCQIKFSEEKEKDRVNKVMITSDENRLVRVLLGATNVGAAVMYVRSRHSQISLPREQQYTHLVLTREHLYSFTCRYALRSFDSHHPLVQYYLVGSFSLGSGVWLSSGANGQ